MLKNYLVNAKFLVSDKDGNKLDDEVFLNKVFEANSTRGARNRALKHIKKRIAKKFGKKAMWKQSGCMVMRHYHKPLPKPRKRSKVNSRQMKLFRV